MPFAKKFNVAKNADYNLINKKLSDPKLKSYVIDDSQYLLVNELFDRMKETGYTKFSDIAKHFRDLIHYINHKLPDDIIVYFLHHTELDRNGTKIKAKTVGKMLDDTLTIEGCFDIVLLTQVEANGKEHYFITQTDGYTPAKSPEDMFEFKIPNDLKFVDTKIREFYDLNEKEGE